MKSEYISTYEVPLPFQFNPWKHHFLYILKIAAETTHPETLSKNIAKIGDSITDLYTGSLELHKILNEIKLELARRDHFRFDNYVSWINLQEKQYRSLTISDGSLWILRLNNDKNKYIHIHPGKYSPFTIRVKSRTLKTAILLAAFSEMRQTDPISISQINYVRSKYLDLPPIKSLSSSGGLGKIISLFKITYK